MIGDGCAGVGESGRSVSIGVCPGDNWVGASGECQSDLAVPLGGVDKVAGDVAIEGVGDSCGMVVVVVPVVREDSSSALSCVISSCSLCCSAAMFAMILAVESVV